MWPFQRKNPTKAWLKLWHDLLDDESIARFETPNDLAGVLADLRRSPEKLAKAFEPLPKGEEILKRIRRCINAEHEHDGLYLVPDPVASSDAEIFELVNEALKRGCQCCEIDIPEFDINIIRRAPDPEENLNSAPLVEELGDLYIDLAYESDSIECKTMQFLGETLYTLAASTGIRNYCLTPLCSGKIPQIDPYAPDFELWKRGAIAVVRWSDESSGYWVDVFLDLPGEV